MMEDFIRRSYSEVAAEQAALSFIENVLSQCGKHLIDFGLPHVEQLQADVPENVDALNQP